MEWIGSLPRRASAWGAGKARDAARGIARRIRTLVEPLLAPLRLVYAYIAARIGTW